MDNYKVFITCAGIGSRLEKLTQNRNKALISLGEKPVISHLLEKFDRAVEFVIAVGYQKDSLIEYIQDAHRELSVTFVEIDNYDGEGSGLGHTFRCCYKHLQSPFIYISNDTVVSKDNINFNPNILGNWIGVYNNSQHKVDPSHYRCAEVIDDIALNILSKDHNTDDVYVGFCGVKDYSIFWSKMFESDNAITVGEVYGLNALEQKNVIYFTNWYDTGNLRSLKESVEAFKSKNHNILPKINEAIWFVGDRCIKFHEEKRFIEERIKRTQFIPKKLIPEILNIGSNHFTYGYVHGKLLSSKTDIQIYNRFLEAMNQHLWTQTPDKFCDQLTFQKIFYREKTLTRINKYFDMYEELDQNIIINGKRVMPLQESILNLKWDSFYRDAHFSWFHGDLHGENVIVTSENNFKLLDWRQNFCQGNFVYGDAYYDLAKILHGLIVRHCFVNKNTFNIDYLTETEVNIDIENSFSYVEICSTVRHWIKDHDYNLSRVDLIVALIFINIAALHHYPYSKFLMLLGRYLLECCKDNEGNENYV